MNHARERERLELTFVDLKREMKKWRRRTKMEEKLVNLMNSLFFHQFVTFLTDPSPKYSKPFCFLFYYYYFVLFSLDIVFLFLMKKLLTYSRIYVT